MKTKTKENELIKRKFQYDRTQHNRPMLYVLQLLNAYSFVDKDHSMVNVLLKEFDQNIRVLSEEHLSNTKMIDDVYRKQRSFNHLRILRVLGFVRYLHG